MPAPLLSVVPARPRQRSHQKPWLALTGGATAALAAAGYWIAQPRPSDGLLPQVLALLPQDSLGLLGINTQPGLLQRFNNLATAPARQVVVNRWVGLQKQLLPGYEWQRDLQPWVGTEVYLAYLSPQQPVLLLSMANGQTIPQVISKLRGTAATSYQGVTLWQQPQPSPPRAIAVIDRWVILGERSSLEKIIRAHQSKTTLATLPDYHQARSQIQAANSLVRGYLNITRATEQSKNPTKSLLRQGMALNITLDGALVTGRGAAWGKSRGSIATNAPPSLAAKIPSSALWAIAGNDLTGTWQWYQTLNRNNPLAPVAAQVLTDRLRATTGLDITKDILSWSRGDFAAALVPQVKSTNSTNPASQPWAGGLILLLSARDRGQGQRFFTALDRVAQRASYQIKTSNQVTQWTTPLGGGGGGHGWLAENTAFLTLGTTIQLQGIQPLTDRPEFQRVMGTTIDRPTGRVFIDLAALRASNNISEASLPQETQTLLAAIHQLGFTSAGGDKFDRFDFQIYAPNQ